MAITIGAQGLDVQHPDQESDVDVTGVLLLADSQVGEDVTCSESGLLEFVGIRLGASEGAGTCRFFIVTGSLDEDNNFTVRDSQSAVTDNDGSGTLLVGAGFSPGLAVEVGDYLGIYGVDPVADGEIPCIVVDNSEGTYRQKFPGATPEAGDVFFMPTTGSRVPLIGQYPETPPPPPLVVEDCGESFRFEACDLRTGIVRAILEPTTADWQTTLNGVGQGSLNVPTKGVRARDIWPHLTSLYMARISGGEATPENPVCEGAFIIDKFSAADTGTTMVGFRSIEDYLFHRVYRASRDYDGSATRLAADLVAYTATNGIPLTGDHEPGAVNTEREYFAWERKNIGEAITELVEAEPGIEWEVVHTKSPGGAWSSTMIFRDTVGTVRAIVLQSDVEGAGYGLDVDAADHATLVDAIGDGSEEAQLIATALDVGVYPQFDATPPFKDIKRMSTLQTQANGYLTDHREPVAVPSMTIMGTGDPDPGLLRNGDIIERVRTSFGAITYDGPARLVSTSWSLREGAPVARTYQFLSTGRASQTVLNQVIEDPCDDPEPLPPPPTPPEAPEWLLERSALIGVPEDSSGIGARVMVAMRDEGRIDGSLLLVYETRGPEPDFDWEVYARKITPPFDETGPVVGDPSLIWSAADDPKYAEHGFSGYPSLVEVDDQFVLSFGCTTDDDDGSHTLLLLHVGVTNDDVSVVDSYTEAAYTRYPRLCRGAGNTVIWATPTTPSTGDGPVNVRVVELVGPTLVPGATQELPTDALNAEGGLWCDGQNGLIVSAYTSHKYLPFTVEGTVVTLGTPVDLDASPFWSADGLDTYENEIPVADGTAAVHGFPDDETSEIGIARLSLTHPGVPEINLIEYTTGHNVEDDYGLYAGDYGWLPRAELGGGVIAAVNARHAEGVLALRYDLFNEAGPGVANAPTTGIFALFNPALTWDRSVVLSGGGFWTMVSQPQGTMVVTWFGPDGPEPPPEPVLLGFASYEINPNETALPDGDGITGSDPWDDDTDTTYTSSFYENTEDLTLRPVGIVEPHTMTLLTKTTLTYRASLLSASSDIAATGSLFVAGFTIPGYGSFPFDIIQFPNSPSIPPADVAAGTIFDVTVEIDWAALVESNPAYQAFIDLILGALDAGTLGVTLTGRAQDDLIVRADSVTKVYKVEFTVEGS